jgi:iron(III) transport system substrate-binding protein
MAGVVVLLIVVGVGSFYAGQATSSSATVTSTVTSMAQSTAADQALYQAAQNEGSLVVYGSIDADQFAVVQNAFTSEYPGISVQYTNLSPSQAYTRISTEISASGHSADIDIQDGIAPTLEAAGYVIPYFAPAAASFPKASWDSQNASTPIVNLPQTMVYNTKMLTPSQLPKTLTDLTDPQWKGKIVMHDPTLGTGGTHYWSTLSTVLGNDTVNNFLKALKSNVNPTLVPSPSSTESDVATGQYAIGMEVFLTDVVGDINNNASVAPLLIQGLPLVTAPSDGIILKGAQHVNAAKLLIDYLASPAGQTVIGDVTNVLPQSSIRIPVSPTVQTVYSLASLTAKYAPGTSIAYIPSNVFTGTAGDRATYTAIFKP